MLCEAGRCPVGQAIIKQEQQCKTMEQKQRANYFYNKSSINQQQQYHQKKNILNKNNKLNE